MLDVLVLLLVLVVARACGEGATRLGQTGSVGELLAGIGLALLAAWHRCTQETNWQLQRPRWGARKLADVGRSFGPKGGVTWRGNFRRKYGGFWFKCWENMGTSSINPEKIGIIWDSLRIWNIFNFGR